jgi:large subunit ribosomal protein L30
MTALKVRQVRSGAGGKQNQKDTLRTLGLRKVGDVSVREDRPEVRGMIATVAHLVSVEEVESK